jgi:enoyl-CoA hydratase/carnithine racemase
MLRAMTSSISVDREEAIATIWLDRPAKRNALDADTMRGFASALDDLATDATVRVVVVRGRGPVFSSGIDHTFLMQVVQDGKRVPFMHAHHQIQETFHKMARMQKPVVAALHGVAVGMACELALAADIRIASEDCVLGLPEIAFGIVPDVGGTTRLVRAVGEARARDLVLSGRLVRARTALGYGLVHDVVEAEALDAAVRARAAQIAAHPPLAVGLAKTLCDLSANSDAATSFRLEGIVQQTLIYQPDLPTHFAAALAFIKDQIANAR